MWLRKKYIVMLFTTIEKILGCYRADRMWGGNYYLKSVQGPHFFFFFLRLNWGTDQLKVSCVNIDNFRNVRRSIPLVTVQLKNKLRTIMRPFLEMEEKCTVPLENTLWVCLVASAADVVWRLEAGCCLSLQSTMQVAPAMVALRRTYI